MKPALLLLIGIVDAVSLKQAEDPALAQTPTYAPTPRGLCGPQPTQTRPITDPDHGGVPRSQQDIDYVTMRIW